MQGRQRWSVQALDGKWQAKPEQGAGKPCRPFIPFAPPPVITFQPAHLHNLRHQHHDRPQPAAQRLPQVLVAIQDLGWVGLGGGASMSKSGACDSRRGQLARTDRLAPPLHQAARRFKDIKRHCGI